MTGESVRTLMERKIDSGRPPASDALQSLPAIRTLERAIPVCLERLAQISVLPSKPVSVLRSGAEIVETLPDMALIALTRGPADALGLVIIDADALSCLVESLTFGMVNDKAPPARRPTRTDATLVSTWVDAVFEELDAGLADEEDIVWAGGFRYRAPLTDPRPLALMLEEPSYRSLRCDLVFAPNSAAADEARKGTVTMVFPATGRGMRLGGEPLIDVDPSSEMLAELPTDWDRKLARAIDPVPVALSAVLGKVSLPLSSFLSLAPGVSLKIPASALQNVRIETTDGRFLCLASLGQGGGARAVRLHLPADPDESPSVPDVVVSEILRPADSGSLADVTHALSPLNPSSLDSIRESVVDGLQQSPDAAHIPIQPPAALVG